MLNKFTGEKPPSQDGSLKQVASLNVPTVIKKENIAFTRAGSSSPEPTMMQDGPKKTKQTPTQSQIKQFNKNNAKVKLNKIYDPRVQQQHNSIIPQ